MTNNTRPPRGAEGICRPSHATPPPLFYTVVLALAAVAAAAMLPELGFISMLVLAASVIFTVSGDAPVLVQLISLLGIGAVYLRGGYLLLGVAAVLWIASFMAGRILLGCGTFQRALMAFILVIFTAAVAAAAVYTRMKVISAEDIAEAAKTLFHDTMAEAVNLMGQSIPLDTANLLIEQYEAIAYTAVMYAPAFVGCTAALIGIIALRLAGLLHNISGSEYYLMEQRIASVDRIFAVIYLVSLIIASVDAGVVGACAANVMMIFMLPAAAAGASAYRVMLIRHRIAGRRGLPFSLLMLILSFVIFSPVVGLMILAFTGVFSAFAAGRFGIGRSSR